MFQTGLSNSPPSKSSCPGTAVQGPLQHSSCSPPQPHSPAFDFSHSGLISASQNYRVPRTTHFSSDVELVKNVTLTLKTGRKRNRIQTNAEVPRQTLTTQLERVQTPAGRDKTQASASLDGGRAWEQRRPKAPELRELIPSQRFFLQELTTTTTPRNPQVLTGKIREESWDHLPWLVEERKTASTEIYSEPYPLSPLLNKGLNLQEEGQQNPLCFVS